MDKVIGLAELRPLRAAWRQESKTLVFTNGIFDLLHLGHVRYLQAARSLGDALVVGLNSDASTRRLKGTTRPLIPQADRAALLAALACVDYVVIFEQDTAESIVAALQPEIYAKGGDYQTRCLSHVRRGPLPESAHSPASMVAGGSGWLCGGAGRSKPGREPVFEPK